MRTSVIHSKRKLIITMGIVGLAACFIAVAIWIIVSIYIPLRGAQAEASVPIEQAVELGEKGAIMKADQSAEKMSSQVVKEDQSENIRREYVAEEKREPLDDSPLELYDIYTQQGNTVLFKAYHPKAGEYTWEIYDQEKNLWERISEKNIYSREDELFRKISVCEIVADEERSIRCQISIPQNPSVKYEAGIHFLSGRIKEIHADDIRAEAGEYVLTQNIPLKVVYQDGNQDTITGLEGLFFLERKESVEQSETAFGNLQETVTTIKTTHNYILAEPGAKECMLYYQRAEEDPIELSVLVTGLDLQAPYIEELDIGKVPISNVDQPVPITVKIKAKDDLTPVNQLEYAFLPEGKEPEEEDWQKESTLQKEVSNGIWRAYCRDQGGNVASKEQDIIVVDTLAPDITLKLEHEAWCKSNRIYVSAKDFLPVEYRYYCIETGEDSGWIKEDIKEVYQNNVWSIQVKDAAGNITEQDICVANIDNQPPVIRGIIEKSKGETVSDEK